IPVSLRIGQYCLRRFLANHVDRARDEKSGDAGKYRSIYHAQALRVMHPKIAAEHAVFLQRPDGAGAGGMMPPAVVTPEILQVLVALQSLARQFLFGDQTIAFETGGQTPHESDSVHHRVQVLLSALLEVLEIDQG